MNHGPNAQILIVVNKFRRDNQVHLRITLSTGPSDDRENVWKIESIFSVHFLVVAFKFYFIQFTVGSIRKLKQVSSVSVCPFAVSPMGIRWNNFGQNV